MNLIIKINMDNDVFGESDFDKRQEVGKIIQRLHSQIHNVHGGRPITLALGDCRRILDSNGNTCGMWEVTDVAW